MAFGKVTAEHVYRCAGMPSPADMELVLSSLMAKSYGDALKTLEELQRKKMFAMSDILTELVGKLQEVSFPPAVDAFLYRELADLE